jgi:hypothetical protein
MGKRKTQAKKNIGEVSNNHTTANRKTERQASAAVVSKADLRSSVNMGAGYPHYWACNPPLPPIR